MKTRRKSIKNKTRKYKGGYLSNLKQLYPSIKYDYVQPNNYKHNITYGEMTYNGLDKLWNSVKDYNIKSFMDLGSGRGVTCFYMANNPSIKKCIGVELVKERYDDANDLKNKLSKLNRNPSKIEFRNEDMFDYLEEENFTKNPYLVWMSNLLYDQDMTNHVYDKLTTKLPNNSILCSSKPPTIIPPSLQFMNNMEIPMSWNPNSNVHMYQIKKE